MMGDCDTSGATRNQLDRYCLSADALTLWTHAQVEVLESTSCSGDAAVRAVIAGSAGSAGNAEFLARSYTRDLSVQPNK